MGKAIRVLNRVCICQHCGNDFLDAGRGRKNKTCPDCKIPKCRTCGDPVPLTLRGGPKGGYVSAGYYCSDGCKPRCAVEGCSKPSRKRGWCANHYATWHQRGDAAAPVLYRWAERTACITCGIDDPELWDKNSRRWCSDTCSATWYKYDGKVPESFNCIICGVAVQYFNRKTRKRLRSDTAYCAAHARHGRTYITATELAAQDGAWCRLCGEPVDVSLSAPHRLSGAVDHYVPRSWGGSDDRSNLQLAHLSCNSSKRHRYIG